MSNALVVGASHSANGHPIAVFGPQVSYFAPGILMQEDLHSPSYDAEGASFPGTGFVELGRGVDYAWSATSAGSDLTDQRLELICNPNGGPVPPTGTYYMFRGKCIPMVNEQFRGRHGARYHQIHLTVHGVVQGWTTALHGKPVAVVNQRSTYNHDVDSVIGFLHFGEPALTHSAQSWMAGASEVDYTFNWFYIDNQNIAYYVSGLDPVRPADVDPNLPTWGTGGSEWRGFLPGLEARARDRPAAGVLRQLEQQAGPAVLRLRRRVRLRARCTGCRCSPPRSGTSSPCTTGRSPGRTWSRRWRPRPPRTWTASRSCPRCCARSAGGRAGRGAARCWRRCGSGTPTAPTGSWPRPSDTQYEQAAAVAIMDQLTPAIIKAIFDPLFAAGGVDFRRVQRLPDGLRQRARSTAAVTWAAPTTAAGRATLVKALDQMTGQQVAQPFGAAVTSRLCGSGGLQHCGPALDAALEPPTRLWSRPTADRPTCSSWTADATTAAAGLTMPQYDAIGFQTLGIVGQPDIPWQNRPTFQQVVSFPAHRPR